MFTELLCHVCHVTSGEERKQGLVSCFFFSLNMELYCLQLEKLQKLSLELGVMVSICNPSYVECIGRRIIVQGLPQANTQDPIKKITKARKG
jgi:hypothetical protein